MNGRGKIHPTFIRNDRHVELNMLYVDSDNSRPIFRFEVFERSREEDSTSAPLPPLPAPHPRMWMICQRNTISWVVMNGIIVKIMKKRSVEEVRTGSSNHKEATLSRTTPIFF